MEKLIETLSILTASLIKRHNNSHNFFAEVKGKLEYHNSDKKEVLISIIKSYAITQYADFTSYEEDLLAKIIALAKVESEKSSTKE
jgi:hypothetical protein